MAYCRTALLVHLIFCVLQLLTSCAAEPAFVSAGAPVSSRRKKRRVDRAETGPAAAAVVRGDNKQQVEHGHGMTASLTRAGATAAATATAVTAVSSVSVRSLRGSGQRSGWLYSISSSSSRNNGGSSSSRRRALSDLAPAVGPSAGGAVFFGAAGPSGSEALPASTSLAYRGRCR